MNIDRINGLNRIYQSNKKNPVKETKSLKQGDTVSLSPEALANAETARISDIAKAAPDIRMDRVNELKTKINCPAYFNNESVLRRLSESISESLGLK